MPIILILILLDVLCVCVGAMSWFMRVSRLTVAVAIIKSGPSEGVGHFTESLSKTLKQQDEGWKSKACGLQEDLLRLRQELILTRSLLKAERRAGPPDGNISMSASHSLRSQVTLDEHIFFHSNILYFVFKLNIGVAVCILDTSVIISK